MTTRPAQGYCPCGLPMIDAEWCSGGHRTTQMPKPRIDLNRRYTITVHHDLRPRRPWRLRPWWATLAHGVAHVGEPGADVWRASTQTKLIKKCERWIRRDALRHAITAPLIEVAERDDY